MKKVSATRPMPDSSRSWWNLIGCIDSAGEPKLPKTYIWLSRIGQYRFREARPGFRDASLEASNRAQKPLAAVLRRLRHLVGGREAQAESDGQLLERFAAAHDEAAFGELMRRHGPLVLSVCRRILHDSNDVDDA